MSLRIDIRDSRLPWKSHRLNISARTDSKKLRNERERAVRTLIDRGDYATLELLRTRKLHITDVTNAVTRGDTETLAKATAHLRGDSLGNAIDSLVRATRGSRARRTGVTYKNWLEQLRRDFGEDANLELITRDQAEAWLHAPKTNGEPWSARTQKHVRMICRRVWKRAGAKNDPWAEAQLAKVRAKRSAFLLPQEWRNLIDAVKGTPQAAIMALGCLAGLREGEVCQLRTDIDVDLEGRRLHIQPRSGEFAWHPKSDNSIRSLYIVDELHEILTEHVRLGYAGQRYFIRLPGHDQPVSEFWIIKQTKASFAKAGLRYGIKGDGLTNHSLRHTFGSWLAIADVNIVKIAELMGNTVAVCANSYVHLMHKDLDAAIEIVGRTARSEKA